VDSDDDNPFFSDKESDRDAYNRRTGSIGSKRKRPGRVSQHLTSSSIDNCRVVVSEKGSDGEDNEEPNAARPKTTKKSEDEVLSDNEEEDGDGDGAKHKGYATVSASKYSGNR